MKKAIKTIVTLGVGAIAGGLVGVVTGWVTGATSGFAIGKTIYEKDEKKVVVEEETKETDNVVEVEF